MEAALSRGVANVCQTEKSVHALSEGGGRMPAPCLSSLSLSAGLYTDVCTCIGSSHVGSRSTLIFDRVVRGLLLCALGFVVRIISRFFRCTADASSRMAVCRHPCSMDTGSTRASFTFTEVAPCPRAAAATAASRAAIWARSGRHQSRGDAKCGTGHGDPSREGSLCARRYRCHCTRSVGGVL